jgi:SAM-dependent methyltransferase
LCHAQDKAAFYREAARLLRPGGRLVVAEYMRTARPFGAPGERLLHKWLDGWAIPDLDTPDEHLSYLSASGFADIQIDDVTAHTCPSLQRLHQITLWSYPLAVLVARPESVHWFSMATCLGHCTSTKLWSAASGSMA